jgi:hypothetical protein
MMSWHRVAIGLEGYQTETVGLHWMQTAARKRPGWQWKQLVLLQSQSLANSRLHTPKSPWTFSLAFLPQIAVQVIPGSFLWDGHQEVTTTVAHQSLHQTFLMRLTWRAEATLEQMVTPKGDE